MCKFAFVALAVGVAVLSSIASAGAAGGQVTLNSNQITIGSGQALRVAGSGYTECAGQSVTVSLLFRRTVANGLEPFSDAFRLSPQQVAVDDTGGFVTSLLAPNEFPGWLGYVSMEGACVRLAPQLLLANVESAVPLGSPAAAQLGLTATHGAIVVVPAAAVRAYPILPDDAVRDPYAKLGDITLLGPDNRTCASVDVLRAALPSGDVVVDASACGAGGALNAVVGREGTATPPTLLLSQAQPREGFAVPLALVFPPPDTGAVPDAPSSGVVGEAPGAPNAGNALSEQERSASSRVPWVPLGLAASVGTVALSLGFGVWRRRRS